MDRSGSVRRDRLVGVLGQLLLLTVLAVWPIRGLTEPPLQRSGATTPESFLSNTGGKQGGMKDQGELRKRLTPLQYHVTQESGTEPAFNNAYWDNHEAGIYVDVVTGEPLFSSTDKFDSGTGWPSFTRPIKDEQLKTKVDSSYGMTRTEVRSPEGDSHLGHLFLDGPTPAKTRYCINSASLRFIPVAKLEEASYGEYLSLFKTHPLASELKTPTTVPSKSQTKSEESCESTTEIATLAGGCFWGVEELIRKLPGVLDTEVGYTGGHTANPDYRAVSTGLTGHAEAVKITFDPSKVSYEEILRYFFRLHDPTTKNQQGNDRGTQYRSVIFTHSAAQRESAERVRNEVDQSKRWKQPVVTEIVLAESWYPAEEYHQDYLEKNPGGYTCHYLRE